LGDSITAGTGTSINCKPFPRKPITIGQYCANGTSYPLLVAKGLRAAGRANRLLNLGIPGATADQVIREEVPLIPSDATLVTLYVGTNDSREFGEFKSSVPDVVAHFTSVYQQILSGIAERSPTARIVLLNVPNEEVIGRSYNIEETRRARFGAISTAFDLWINSQYPKYAVVDTLCDARSYDPSRRYRASVHLNDDGAKDLAQAILQLVLATTSPPPATKCEWLTPASTAK
jgi:lysophospholipase L1-like esterase